jgi:hypothetical protein
MEIPLLISPPDFLLVPDLLHRNKGEGEWARHQGFAHDHVTCSLTPPPQREAGAARELPSTTFWNREFRHSICEPGHLLRHGVVCNETQESRARAWLVSTAVVAQAFITLA